MSTRKQDGFTLLELLMAIGVLALIVPVVAASIYQVSRGTLTINRAHVVQLDIDRASAYFSRDLSQAQTTDLPCGGPQPTMRVDWLDQTAWGEAAPQHYARYSIDSGTTLLKREYDGTFITAARNVKSITFSRSGNFITIVITSSLGGKAQTLSYFTTPRSDGALTCA